MKLKHIITATCAALALVNLSYAGEYNFEDPKGVNNASFTLDAPLESISGSATGVSGLVQFDPNEPSATSGYIALETATLHVGNSKMKQHIHAPSWMNVKKYPEIRFDLSSLSEARTEGNVTSGVAKGTLTMKGVTKEIHAPVSLTWLEGSLSKRFPKQKGDLLVIRSDFTVNREDFGIQVGKHLDKVATEIEISLRVAGGYAQ